MPLNEFISQLSANLSREQKAFPSKELCRQFVDDLYALLFEFSNGKTREGTKLKLKFKKLTRSFSRLLKCSIDSAPERKKATELFFDALPPVYDMLMQDAEAILAADPAADSLEEIILAYPGFFATYVYRIAHQLHKQNLLLHARIMSEYAHSKTGIDIHPAAIIGHSFVIDHGTGIVVGQTSEVGNHVTIYQGVTLGALAVSKAEASVKRHPTIGDNVVIYAGATILGGKTVIGAGSIIGGNVWLTNSVSPNYVVYHKSEVHIKDNNPFPEPLNFVI